VRDEYILSTVHQDEMLENDVGGRGGHDKTKPAAVADCTTKLELLQ
jgi:hypothetical protein